MSKISKHARARTPSSSSYTESDSPTEESSDRSNAPAYKPKSRSRSTESRFVKRKTTSRRSDSSVDESYKKFIEAKAKEEVAAQAEARRVAKARATNAGRTPQTFNAFAGPSQAYAPAIMQPIGNRTSSQEPQELQDTRAALASMARHPEFPPAGFGAESLRDDGVFAYRYGANKGCQLGLCKVVFLYKDGKCRIGTDGPHENRWSI